MSPLERYRAKRDFSRTPEPDPGGEPRRPANLEEARAPEAPGDSSALADSGDPLALAAPGGCGRFVVHRHRAGRLHYDLRLEIDGVLASWALPKGPTRDPDERRFAVRTEDHPLAYLDFEGPIPKGEYGGGDLICWDWGTFEPELTWDPGAAVRAGELKLRLRGEKLAGRFTLVRTGDGERRGGEQAGDRAGGRGDARGGGESEAHAGGLGEARDRADEGAAWLLIAKSGPDAIPGWDPEAHPASVRTGRTNEEVAAGVAPRVDHFAPAPLPTLDPAGSRPLAQPRFVEPMLATPGTAPFDGDDWLFEPKWDGYRLQAIVAGGKVLLRTRNGHDAGRLFPELLGPPAWLAAPEAIVDGEVVALDQDGRPDFSLLQARLGGGFSASDLPTSPDARAAGRGAPLVFMAFDLPWCAGRSYLDVALEERKELLRLVLREHPRVRYGAHVARDGVAFFAAAAAQGLEGAMAKHRRSRYEAGRRSTAWLKLKVRPTQELVVGGYVPGRGSHRDLGSLLVGVMEGGLLRYAGRVGSGIDGPTRARLRAALDARARADHPFGDTPAGLAATPGAAWAEPEVVIRAEIGGWSRDGIVRQATFVEEAPLVDPATVERQEAVGPEAAARALAKARPSARRSGVALATTAAPSVPARVAAAPADASAAGAAPAAASSPATASSSVVASSSALASSSADGTSSADSSSSPSTFAPPTPAEIAALEALPGRGGTWLIAGREIALTNLDKVLAPGASPDEPAVTKRDLVRYMTLVAPVMLPHLAGRALNLARYPNGVDGAFFWQKEVAKGTPDWVTRWREPDPPDRQPHAYVVADGIATLAWLGNQAAIELHPWTSPVVAPAEPRWALVDIDPGPRTTWDETLVLARLFRRALEHLGVAAVPKVTGKRGLQVFIPVRGGYTFEETRAWVEQVSRAVGGAVPDLVSWEWSKDRRDGRARLDFTQNWRNRTLVGPYSARPAPGLPVSAPIAWDELDDPALRPDRWTIRTVLARVAAVGDLFAAALGPGQELPRL
jgi:bifunctional non-homologous end joining protein LigD